MKSLINSRNTNLLLYIFFAIITFCKGINLTSDDKLYIALYGVGIILLIIKMFNEKYTIRELKIILILVVTSIIIALVSKNISPLFMTTSIICLKNGNVRDLTKVMFYTLLGTTILMIFLSLVGIINNNFIIHHREGFGTFKRFCFGYIHPNIVHMNLLVLVVMFYYIYSNKLNLLYKFIASIFIGLCNVGLYFFTFSRTSFILVFIVIVYELFLKNKILKNAKFFKILQYSFIIILLISILLSFMYKNINFVKWLDIKISGRIYYCNQLIMNYFPSFFGDTKIDDKILFDNSYFSLLYNCGIIFTIIMTYLYTKAGKIFYRKKLYNELLIIAFFCVFCFIENVLLMCMYNFTLLFLGSSIFEEKIKINER